MWWGGVGLFIVVGWVGFLDFDYNFGVLELTRIRVPILLVRHGRLPTDRPHASLHHIGGRRLRCLERTSPTSYRWSRIVHA